MWQWDITPEDITPTGFGICGGEVKLTEGYSGSRSSSVAPVQPYMQPAGYSGSQTSSVVELWQGTRSGYGGCRTSSTLDMSSGLTIISDYGMRVDNVNMLRVGGALLGSNATPSRYQDVTLVSGPSDEIDGSGLEVLDGGDSGSNTNTVDGGSSDGYGVITVGGVAYAQIIDMVSDYLIYKGWALAGSSITNAVWRIQKIVIGFDDDVTKTWADGNADFDNIWSNRLSYSYS